MTSNKIEDKAVKIIPMMYPPKAKNHSPYFACTADSSAFSGRLNTKAVNKDPPGKIRAIRS